MQTFDNIGSRLDNCAECETAVSPLAYLADLINYALQYILKDVKRNDKGEIVDFKKNRS